MFKLSEHHPRRTTAVATALLTLLTASACGAGTNAASAPSPTNNNELQSAAQALQLSDWGQVSAQTENLKRSPGLSPDWHWGPFMQVFVRAYRDSDGDGIGDLRGLQQQLDYLQQLGIQGLWLMPIHASADHDHGYATRNYREIEPAYGQLSDLTNLLQAAHQRGIGVIADYVINHASSEHPMFAAAQASAQSPFRKLFIWEATAPSHWSIYGSNPWTTTANGAYFSAFWSGMPDFNWRNPEVKTFHDNNLRFGLNLGLDGWRFDAVGQLVENGPVALENQPENFTIVAGLRQLVQSYEGRTLVCEAPSASQAFGQAQACGSAFAFDLKDLILKAVTQPSASGLQALGRYFETAPLTMATFLANHDGFAGDRLWHQFQGQNTSYELAAATYLLLPGVPYIYYGEEIGMGHAEGLTGDAALRAPMSWDTSGQGFSTGKPFRALAVNRNSNNVAQQLQDPNALLHSYRRLVKLRRDHPALLKGDYRLNHTSPSLLGFERRWQNQTLQIWINFDTQAQPIPTTDRNTWQTLASNDTSQSASTPSDRLAARSWLVLEKR